MYLFIKKGQLEKYQEVAPGVAIELDKKGDLLGIEILRASKIFGSVPKIKEKTLGELSAQISAGS